MLTGSMLIEKVFSIPGIGKLAVDAMNNRDLPLLQGTVVYIALVFVVVNLVVDIPTPLSTTNPLWEGRRVVYVF